MLATHPTQQTSRPKAASATAITPLVRLHQGRPVTDSLAIARELGRLHKNVLATLDSLIADESISRLDFKPAKYLDAQALLCYSRVRLSLVTFSLYRQCKFLQSIKRENWQRVVSLCEDLKSNSKVLAPSPLGTNQSTETAEQGASIKVWITESPLLSSNSSGE